MMNNEPENSAELPIAEMPETEVQSEVQSKEAEQSVMQDIAEDGVQAAPEVVAATDNAPASEVVDEVANEVVEVTSSDVVDAEVAEVSENALPTKAEAPVAELPPTEIPSVETPDEAQQAPVMAEPVAEVAIDIAPTPEATPAVMETEAAEEIDDNFIKEKVAAAKVAKKKAPAKPRKPTKRERLKLPDLGDGSGYEPPEAPAVDLNTGAAVDEAEEAFWYAVHCYSGYENKVKHSLEQRIETMGMAGRILEIVVPTEEEIEVRDGKRKTVERRVFPGYVLVRMKMSEESWFVVRNTPGVTRFIGMGNRPQPLTQQEVNQVLRRMEAEAPKIRVSFKSGQRVRITDGPFADFPGLVDKIDTERAKVTVLVSFFGRETPVELDFLQVEKM